MSASRSTVAYLGNYVASQQEVLTMKAIIASFREEEDVD
jgi:hypothetical protein